MNCTTLTSQSLKWNNEVCDSFFLKRGFRQGDPVSPYLFILYMEKIILLNQQKVHEGD